MSREHDPDYSVLQRAEAQARELAEQARKAGFAELAFLLDVAVTEAKQQLINSGAERAARD